MIYLFVSQCSHFRCGLWGFYCILLVFFMRWSQLSTCHLYPVVLCCDWMEFQGCDRYIFQISFPLWSASNKEFDLEQNWGGSELGGGSVVVVSVFVFFCLERNKVLFTTLNNHNLLYNTNNNTHNKRKSLMVWFCFVCTFSTVCKICTCFPMLTCWQQEFV